MLVERNRKKQEWTSEEIKLLQLLYPQFSSKKWKRISEEFRAKGYNRTEIECREKWINFVDPSINKKDWQEWELRRMYQIHSEMGSRWCFIQKQIGRTQNMIKNRFYGTLRNYIRLVLNYFSNGRSCMNYQITKISPKLLNEMYNSQNAFFYLNGEVKNAIFYMGFKVDKKMLIQRIRERRGLYAKLNQFIVSTLQSIKQLILQTEEISDHNDEKDQEKLEEASEHHELASRAARSEHLVKKQEYLSAQLNLPEPNPTLQNVYLSHSYQNMLMMPYHQPSPTMFYCLLSYL